MNYSTKAQIIEELKHMDDIATMLSSLDGPDGQQARYDHGTLKAAIELLEAPPEPGEVSKNGLRDLRVLAAKKHQNGTELATDLLTDFSPEKVLPLAMNIDQTFSCCAAYINAYATVRGISSDDAFKEIFPTEKEGNP